MRFAAAVIAIASASLVAPVTPRVATGNAKLTDETNVKSLESKNSAAITEASSVETASSPDFIQPKSGLRLRRRLHTTGCYPQTNKVRIQSVTGQAIQVNEVQVYSHGVNVAQGKTATQGSLFKGNSKFAASKAVDGDNTTFSHTARDCVYLEIDLGGPYEIESIEIVNRYCGIDPSDPRECLCRLSHATVSLLDEDGKWVEGTWLGDTCGVEELEHVFPADCPPTLSPSPTAAPVGSSPSMTLSAVNSTLITGGLVGEVYSIDVNAGGLSVPNVVIEWAPGLGAGSSTTVNVVGGEAAHTINVSYSTPGTYTFTAVVSYGGTTIATSTLVVTIAGMTISTTLPSTIDAGVSNVYTFQADDIPASTTSVTFGWSFGTGSSGTGSATVAVVDGSASFSPTFTYSSDGAYALVVQVSDTSTGAILTTDSSNVMVGDTIGRNYTLNVCDTWMLAAQGGQGLTMDAWDISDIPPGAVFDLSFDMYSVPDKIMVEYPVPSMVYDSGWRGSTSYTGSLYPGGITSPGQDQVNGIFERLSISDDFRITVSAPSSGTAWKYQVRCRNNSTALTTGEDYGPEWYAMRGEE